MLEPDQDTPIFKFLNSQDAHFLLGGSLKLGSFRKYRLMERLSGDSWIGDRQEGIAITHRQEEHHKEWRGFNNRHVSIVDGYLFCASCGDRDALRQAMMVDAPIRYDGCVEIMSLHTLGGLIAAAPHLEGAVADYFKVVCGSCIYEDKPEIHTGGLGANAAADPFLKPARYAAQSEVRIALLPKVGVRTDDELKLQIKVPERLFRREPDGEPVPEPEKPFSMSKEGAIAELTEVSRIWDAGPGKPNTGAQRGDDLHSELLPRLNRAYGSLRFNDHLRSATLDLLLMAPPPHPAMIYNILRWVVGDLRAGNNPRM